jgi:hypothetical protein
MINQYLSAIAPLAIQFIPLEAVKLPEVSSHAVNTSQIRIDNSALKSNVVHHLFVVFESIERSVKLTTPPAQTSTKVIDPIQAVSFSRISGVGGIAPCGEPVTEKGANDSAANNLQNLISYIKFTTHGFAGFVWWLFLTLIGCAIGYLLGEVCRKSKLLGWAYVVSEPNSVISTI